MKIFLNAKELHEALTFCAPAISKDESRPTLMKYNISMGEGKLIIRACDGFRCCEMKVPFHHRAESETEGWKNVQVRPWVFPKITRLTMVKLEFAINDDLIVSYIETIYNTPFATIQMPSKFEQSFNQDELIPKSHELEIVINSTYLAEAAKGFGKDQGVIIRIIDDHSPIMMYSNQIDPDRYYMLLPLRK